jgi:hypothetical protein
MRLSLIIFTLKSKGITRLSTGSTRRQIPHSLLWIQPTKYFTRSRPAWPRSLIAVHQPRTFPTTSHQITNLHHMLVKGSIMSGTSPKQLEATACNAQRSTKTGDACGPQTPCDGVAAIPDQGRGQASDRGSQTSALKPFGGWDDIPVERSAVAYPSRFSHITISADTLNIVRCQGSIELSLDRAMYSLQDYRGLSHPQPSETPPIDEN